MSNVLDLKNPQAMPEEAEDAPMDVEALTALAMASAMPPKAIAWEAHHPLSHASRRRHYSILGVFVAIGAAVAWWQSSPLVLLAVVLGTGALEVRERWGGPVRVAIDDHGVIIDGRRHPHASLASFDIHMMPDGTKELSLHSSHWYLPHMRLPLGDQNPDDVHAALLQYIPKDHHAIPLWDSFVRKS